MTALPLAAPDWDGRWWEEAAMQAQLGPAAKGLAHCAGPDAGNPDYAFLLADAPDARRYLVLWRDRLLAACDVFAGDAAWEGPPGAVRVLERRGDGETVRVQASAAGQAIDQMSFAGVRVGDRAILFHTARTTARSAVWFDVDGPPRLRWLACGLTPGSWEIWREAYLIDPEGFVPRRAGALYFEGRPGRYYLKKLY